MKATRVPEEFRLVPLLAMNDTRQIRKFEADREISSRFQFLWQQYIRAIDVGIAMASGTLALVIGALFNEESIFLASIRGEWSGFLVMGAILSLALSLIGAFFWRGYSGFLMEKEVFGKPERIVDYLKEVGSPASYWFQKPVSAARWRVWIWARTIAIAGLGIGWLLLAIVLVALAIGEIGSAPPEPSATGSQTIPVDHAIDSPAVRPRDASLGAE